MMMKNKMIMMIYEIDTFFKLFFFYFPLNMSLFSKKQKEFKKIHKSLMFGNNKTIYSEKLNIIILKLVELYFSNDYDDKLFALQGLYRFYQIHGLYDTQINTFNIINNKLNKNNDINFFIPWHIGFKSKKIINNIKYIFNKKIFLTKQIKG